MSLNSAMIQALSGLQAMSRSAGVVSNNLANALTEGYGRQEVELTARSTGGQGSGVTVSSIQRLVDQVVINDRRLADGAVADSSVRSAFLETISAVLGEPGSGSSLTDLMGALGASLIEAAARPESDAALGHVVTAFSDVVAVLNDASDQVERQRTDADRSIAKGVETLNLSLQMVDDLNSQIARLQAGGNDANALIDQRQVLIDRISEIVPVKQVERDTGAIALMTQNGAILLDAEPAEIGFSQSSLVTAHMTYEGGTLSGLTIKGTAIDLTRDNHALSGGALGGHLSVRDELGVAVQSELDAFARDLVERLSDPAVDATLPTGAPGLLTDGGGVFDPLDEAGLAGRLSLNPFVDPLAGGEVWRIRAGLGAATPGDSGQSALLDRLSSALDTQVAPGSGSYSHQPMTASQHATELLSSVGMQTQRVEADLAHRQARLDVLSDQELATGVDSDVEMQRLLVIERAYAANARVIETVEQMFDSLLRI
ncbi:flagellar hook-associated protein FlgK [Qingshengfaniella alkalisoli]|uniref:Flagellar hook-associated protein 1 n=1 Tax=Qingshengfaniella alkalisoli TaxID=2599296 RepID=A0A5B8IA60_9RHOB|nr:flagellar hook-associated protein FlgK [Qingshengfaniella alkalisoli]QDY70066.1 flagellar hook-associated protein FlgK [Qingshengfaniella alkalisoli]